MNIESGESLIALAGTVSVVVAKELDQHELALLCEFLGLLKHNLDIIRFRRLAEKAHKIVEEKKELKK